MGGLAFGPSGTQTYFSGIHTDGCVHVWGAQVPAPSRPHGQYKLSAPVGPQRAFGLGTPIGDPPDSKILPLNACHKLRHSGPLWQLFNASHVCLRVRVARVCVG